MKSINLSVRNESPFYYGMKVFVIMANPHNDSKTFRDKCPVCEDTREVEIKGFKLPCPMCNGYRVRENAISITFLNFSVVEYIINEVRIKGSEYKTDYKLSSNKLPYAEWYGFARWGNGYSDIRARKFDTYHFRDVDVEKVDIVSNAVDCCFYSKTDANKFCKRLHERQKEMLDKFNEDHGTDHEYPFTY